MPRRSFWGCSWRKRTATAASERQVVDFGQVFSLARPRACLRHYVGTLARPRSCLRHCVGGERTVPTILLPPAGLPPKRFFLPISIGGWTRSMCLGDKIYQFRDSPPACVWRGGYPYQKPHNGERRLGLNIDGLFPDDPYNVWLGHGWDSSGRRATMASDSL